MPPVIIPKGKTLAAGKSAAARAMRELDEDAREELILMGAPVVVDGRSRFEFRKKNQAIAESYRKPKIPEKSQ